ncbi:hypothetical protein [Yersinia mollaretii]|uniref:Fimbrial protein n=1 Tax=Yersinia mollaretii TaxID=33060 RepID=A0AA36LRD1_YERMO|nr:hypothetical protein [Yersinia mollaretii]CNI50487.1 Uncharacterised protein [Yersinia mollaretii]
MLVNKTTPLILFALLFNYPLVFAATMKQLPDAEQTQYILIENNADNNYFVTPVGTVSSHMAGVKSSNARANNRLDLGYIDNGNMADFPANFALDMWLENSQIQRPLDGLRCGNGTACSTLPQLIDDKGFYGVRLFSGGSKGAQGIMSDSFYYYLAQLPVGDVLRMEINLCSTPDLYDANSGERCKDRTQANWSKRNVSHKKIAHLRLLDIDFVSQVLINTDGIPVVGEGSADCKNHSIGGQPGIVCKMLSYDLQATSDINYSSLYIYPVINNPLLVSATTANDVKFSLDGNNWKNVSGSGENFTFSAMKNSKGIYVFFSSRLFKQMLKQGNLRAKNLVSFRLANPTSGRLSQYDIPTSNELIIKPRDFELGISSTDGSSSPHQQGTVGVGNPPLIFEYNVTTSGMTQADSVKIMVSGPHQKVNGIDYCRFSSADSRIQVPFPAQLIISSDRGAARTFAAGCNHQWFDITDISWSRMRTLEDPAVIGIQNSANVSFIIPMDDPISQKTFDGQSWLGAVSASGEIHVQATWNDSY